MTALESLVDSLETAKQPSDTSSDQADAGRTDGNEREGVFTEDENQTSELDYRGTAMSTVEETRRTKVNGQAKKRTDDITNAIRSKDSDLLVILNACDSQDNSSDVSLMTDVKTGKDENCSMPLKGMQKPAQSLTPDVDHPTSLLKCELLIDEEIYAGAKTHRVTESLNVDDLEKIDKEEIDVVSDSDIDVFDTLSNDYDSVPTFVNKEKISSNNVSSNEVTGGLASLSKIIDSLTTQCDYVDTNYKRRRKSVDLSNGSGDMYTSASSKYCGRYSRPRDSSMFSPPSCQTSDSSKTANLININNTVYNILPLKQSGELTVQQLNKRHDRRATNNLHSESKHHDDDNEISVISDTTFKGNSTFLIPESHLPYTSHLPTSDALICSNFSRSASPPHTSATTFSSLLPCTAGLTLLGPSPSRQSCYCPLCGRHIAQRRSLKQHLMSNFHKLSALEADHTVRRSLATLRK